MSTKKKYYRKGYPPYKLYIPENIDIDRLLVEHPLNFNGMPLIYRNYRDKLVYILHLINSIPNNTNDFDYDEYKGFTPINKEFLSRRIHDYREYINYLKRHGIITEGTSYSVDRYSRGLKFTDTYRVKVKAVIITSNTLIKSIVTNNDNRNVEAERKLSFLKQWYNDNLEVDFESAMTYLERDRPNARLKAIKKRAEKYKPEVLQYLLPIDEIVELGEISKSRTVTIIKEKDFGRKLIIDNKSMRFHTPLTRLKKEMRQFISYDNERLVSIDITNSQPLLSIIVLDIGIFDRLWIKGLISKYNLNYKDIQHIYNSNQITFKHSPTYTMLVNLIKRTANKEDVIAYKESVIAGNYYETFGERLCEKGLIPEEIMQIGDFAERRRKIRGFAKVATFRAFFDKKYAARYSPYVRVFKACFPNVYLIFQQIKRGRKVKCLTTNKIIEEKAYNTLALMLQRFESRLVLEKVCVEINDLNHDIPLFTIHDSIITTERYADFVYGIFMKNIEETLGVTPLLQRELW